MTDRKNDPKNNPEKSSPRNQRTIYIGQRKRLVMVHLADLMLTNDLAWLINIAKLRLAKKSTSTAYYPAKNLKEPAIADSFTLVRFSSLRAYQSDSLSLVSPAAF